MRNLQQVQVRTSSGFEKICPFPVGYIYMSTNGTSPASTYGGTWSALTDSRFLRPSGSWNSQGGSDTNKHNHWMPVGKENGLPGFSTTGIAGWSDGEQYGIRAARVAHSIFLEDEYFSANSSNATETTTYGTTISTVPSYRTCYAWYRTA
jgi:hypothetical protein